MAKSKFWIQKKLRGIFGYMVRLYFTLSANKILS